MKFLGNISSTRGNMYNLFGRVGNTETFTVAVSIDRSALKYRVFTYI